MNTGISGKSPACLPEIGGNAVELPPGDYHLVAVRRINGNGRLVRTVAEDVVAICIDICLETGEHAELRDHARRSLYFPRRRRRHVVFFQWLVEGRLVDRRQCLRRSASKGQRQKQYGS